MADKSKMIEITLPKDRGRKEDPRGEYVAVNGVGMFVPRGEKVKIPEAYYNALMIKAQALDMADDYAVAEEKKSNA